MSNPQAIQKLSIRHEAILEYLMANPKIRLQDVAAHFGVTGAWLSQIIHSDIFQNQLRQRTDTSFHHTVLPLREKMHAAASMALDKVIETISTDGDLRTANDVATDMLDRLGFGAKPIGHVPAPGTTINNNQFVTINATRDEIAEARKMLEAKARPLGVGVTVDGVSLPIALPAQSPAEECVSVPEGNIPFSPWQDGAGETGDKVRGEGP